MGKATAITARRQAEKASEPTKMEAGHDGRPQAFMVVRDYVYADGRREATESPFNTNHSVLTSLFHKKDGLSPRQYYAGERLLGDWRMAGITPRASSVIVGNGSGGSGMLPNDHKVDAMKRHGKAIKALGWAYPIIEMVVERDLTIQDSAKLLSIDRKKASAFLEMALHLLADHYGM